MKKKNWLNEKLKVKEKFVNKLERKIKRFVNEYIISLLYKKKKKILLFCFIFYSWLYFRGWSIVVVCIFSLYVCKNGYYDIIFIFLIWVNWVWFR